MPDNKEILKTIVDEGDFDALIEFLKNLSDDERLSVSMKTKGLFYIYKRQQFDLLPLKEKQKNDVQWRLNMLYVAAFVTLDMEKFLTLHPQAGGYQKILDYGILDWYRPDWFDDYCKEWPWLFGDYPTLMLYKQKGYVNPDRTAIIRLLSQGIPLDNDKLLNETTEEHIWYLLEEDTPIEPPQSYIGGMKADWREIFAFLVENQKIDLSRLVSKLLDCIHFETIPTFFFDILGHLKPNSKILLPLQAKLCAALNVQETKPVNVTLKLIKTLCKEPTFEFKGFLDHAPVLLVSETKGIRNSTVGILDTLMKVHPDHKEELGILMTQALSHQDSALQIKVLKTLQKHHLLDNPSVIKEISIYVEDLFHEAKSLLPEMEKIEDDLTCQPEITPPDFTNDTNKILECNDYDDLVFFFSQAFENNRPYDFDLFLTNILSVDPLLRPDNLDKMQPAFQKAFKMIQSDNIGKGFVTYLMAWMFVNYAKRLNARFAAQNAFLESSLASLQQTQRRILYPENFRLYHVFYQRVLLVEQMLERENDSVLLSTPTHEPCWIDPAIFIERVRLNQQNRININAYDFQIAVNRVRLDNSHLPLINDKLEDELHEMFSFLCDGAPFAIDSVQKPELWLPVLLKKRNGAALHSFRKKFDELQDYEYPFAYPKWSIDRVGFYGMEPEGPWLEGHPLNIRFENDSMIRKSTISNIFSKLMTPEPAQTIYADTIYLHDDVKFLLLTPASTDHSLLFLLKTHLSDSTFTEPNPLRQATRILPVLIDIWNEDCGEISYLYLSAALADKDKTVRNLAAELWIKTIGEGTMNSELLGQTLGRLEHEEFAPLKRLTDLIIATMFGISTLHHQALETLLSTMIAHMGDDPIKGTKKLLEIYLEVLVQNRSKASEEALSKLEAWKATKSLSAVIKKIEKL